MSNRYTVEADTPLHSETCCGPKALTLCMNRECQTCVCLDCLPMSDQEENKKVKAPIPEAPAPIKYAGDDVIYMGYDKG